MSNKYKKLIQDRLNIYEKVTQCLVCNSEYFDWKPITDKGNGFEIEISVICNLCDHVFITPVLNEKELEDYYLKNTFSKEIRESALPTPEGMEFRDKRAKKRFELIKYFLSEDSKNLEIGCSSGNFLKLISETSIESIGIDPSTSYVNYASKQNLKVINDTYPCLELENLKFDNIFIFHVIEHVANPIELLVNIKRNLKQNGKLFIELPLLDKVLDKRKKLSKKYFQKSHLHDFNSTNLEFVLNNLGLKITNIQNISKQRPDDKNYLLTVTIDETKIQENKELKNNNINIEFNESKVSRYFHSYFLRKKLDLLYSNE